MNIHEYQAKAILSAFGVPVPRGASAATPDEAEAVARGLGGISFVVKAQIHAGGRGKGAFRELPPGAKGGVRVMRSAAEVRASAAEMLGNTLVTLQTGPEGRKVARIHVEEGVQAERELYVSLLVDRATGRVCFIASRAGGMEIEEVAQATPERIATILVDPATGFQPLHGRKLAQALGLAGDLARQAAPLADGLYEAFVAKDMSLLEINPLVVTRDGRLLCLDAKVSFDPNALFRHPDVARMRDDAEEDGREMEAARHDLSYVALEGAIGCMVNGAGLAMATMDIIHRYGHAPANFLDVGGGATKEKVEAAFRIITADPRVEAILVNIFGGIMKCDVIAAGIVAAVRRSGLAVPLVVRLAGTNVEEGKRILRASGLNVIPADDLDDAAQKIVAAVKKEAA